MKRFDYESIKDRLLNKLKLNKEEKISRPLEQVVEVYIEGINTAANYAETITLKSNILKRPDNPVTEEEIQKYFE